MVGVRQVCADLIDPTTIVSAARTSDLEGHVSGIVLPSPPVSDLFAANQAFGSRPVRFVRNSHRSASLNPAAPTNLAHQTGKRSPPHKRRSPAAHSHPLYQRN